jgi:hypothetical protein
MLSETVKNFDEFPDSALIDLSDASILACRSKRSLYRDAQAGALPHTKIGHSTRIRVSDLRAFLAGVSK